ncbi:sulfide/dihydroorotate dehydrogenase-like FAD/NAD-binding protein [Thermanaeromonas sp. C210]|uniref:sulfide/dihydroorotate dehydrogenase-like FAD/NAD-binding protein n=1 Tax=Thermanaeromonas sp. C210 TaxID=2731925 RepID=UPI00155C3158|nr:sulfide/dihydroorotate dehydrogenase-like FAD/NAD-binding protein [Thermanaeromonas sp. C210]MBE3572313.1 sulfide/dihydroorotate dehydrogenase-like FAD/NAD-binding protein [Moorella humiferrea]GFN23323.1 ferredoxin-NADP+ reductase subunit alpha [Thermanaeromonas sp. C210]
MYPIVKKRILAPGIKLLEVKAPDVARKAQAGQFIILRIDEPGERIPLTIADFNRDEGTVTTIFQEVGYTTQQLGRLEEGDTLLDFVGPLGRPTEIENYGRVVCVGGGVGVAPIYPIARALKEAGNEVISIIGARSRELLILEQEMRSVSDELLVSTDDGSYGHKGFVTDLLVKVLQEKKVDRVWGIGPVVMMKAVSEATRPFKVPTIVSMNPIMVDGTGMCGACRVSVGGETKFGCVDGPEFDGHQVDWDLALRRLRMYRDEEARALAFHQEKRGGCQCR